MLAPNSTPKIAFSAGESSGDQHAAALFKELKKLLPNIQGVGMGSTKMRQAGIELCFDSAGIAVIGLLEVLQHYTEIRRALKRVKAMLVAEKPDLLVCIDYQEFNLKLARFAKRNGIKVLFYIGPQIWAWRANRVISYGQASDRMAVIFPFETAYYQAENIAVTYVGHPLLDQVHPQRSKAENTARFSLAPEYPVVGLLPGSRINEIKRLLPTLLAAAERLTKQHPGIQFVLAQADSISDDLLQPYLSRSTLAIKPIKNQAYDVFQCCDAIMTTSGTASLELALLKIPMVITYKLSPITYFLGKKLITTKFIGLPNIIAGKAIIKELIQGAASSENLSAEIHKILTNHSYRTTMIDALAAVKTAMGKGGGSKNMAVLAKQMLLAEHPGN